MTAFGDDGEEYVLKERVEADGVEEFQREIEEAERLFDQIVTDVDAVCERSLRRVTERISDDSPLVADGEVCCPFCKTPLSVRRTKLGRLDAVDGRRPYIDGVALKCAGDDGCGFRPDFDVPLREGRGAWPALSGKEEWDRERDRREGEVLVDAGYTPAEGASVEERLEALGYLDG